MLLNRTWPIVLRSFIAILFTAGSGVAVRSIAAETENLQIQPRWVDDDHFWFSRMDSEGKREVVDVDAKTGEMSIRNAKVQGQAIARTSGLQGGEVPVSGPAMNDDTEIRFENKTDQEVTVFWVDSGGQRVKYETLKPGETHPQHTFVGHSWEVIGADDQFYGSIVADGGGQVATAKTPLPRADKKPSRRRWNTPQPDQLVDDGKFQVRLHDGQLQKRTTVAEDVDSKSWQTIDVIADGRDSDTRLTSLSASPDGKWLAMWLRKVVAEKPVYTYESSPPGGGRAVLHSHDYPLPGDAMDQFELVLCDVTTWESESVDLPVFDFGRPRIRWTKTNQMVIEKIDRGHQRFRLFVIDPETGAVRTPIDEETETFIWTMHGPTMSLVTYLDDSDQVIHASEVSGWMHLYLVDLTGQTPTRPITKGDFLVREIINIDEKTKELDLVIGDYHKDQDPYHRHLARVQWENSRLTPLTDGDGDHQWKFSPDRKYVVVTHSRVDQPPTHELRSTEDGTKLATLAVARRIAADDSSESGSDGMPTVFHAKGRDGETDIWGMISFPAECDLDQPDDAKKYPVIEAIYAGPHGSHVPKQYRSSSFHTDLNAMGFIVVQIDGMGTANRSKAFHDVCWHNLKDAGFPDRIAWMKAAAEKFPCMDLDRVGIYGTSAGGQNAMGALLFHGDFYKAAMGSCGCHDNRMDKASWNEQWMGYPVGPQYAESSNVDHAGRLQGDLMLIVGELDNNVPPESTLRVVDALIKNDKDFQLLVIPGMGHSSGGEYGWKRTKEFFKQSLKPDH